jgi:hypothetical protein
MHLNAVSARTDKILGIDTENLRFYLSPSLETLPLSLLESRLRSMSQMHPDARLAAELRKEGVRRVFTTRAAASHPQEYQPYLRSEFLNSQAILEFADEGTLVYRLQ